MLYSHYGAHFRHLWKAYPIHFCITKNEEGCSRCTELGAVIQRHPPAPAPVVGLPLRGGGVQAAELCSDKSSHTPGYPLSVAGD